MKKMTYQECLMQYKSGVRKNRWSEKEKDLLSSMLERKVVLRDMASALGRSEGAILHQRSKTNRPSISLA